VDRSGQISVRQARPDDGDSWLALRCELWPEGSEKEHAEEIAAYFSGEATAPLAVMLAFDASGGAAGFAELSIRWCAEGCQTDRVAYLEGWYVLPESRREGVGRALVEAAADWARDQGCSEFASDTDVANAQSTSAHMAVGFEDVGLVRCFRRTL